MNRRVLPLIIGSLLLPLGCGNDEPTGPSFSTLAVTTASLRNAAPSVAYSETLAATGGDSDYTWSVTGGSLPTGLSLATPTGLISGAATGASSTFTVQVASGDGQTAEQALSITVTLAVTTTSLPNAAETVTYNEILAATGGDGSYTWALSGGTLLPTGLSLATNGTITGTPTGASSTFTVEATSGDGQTATQQLTITINVAITTTSLPDGVENVDYGTETLTATGGDGSYTWAPASGSGPLPTGLSLATNGDVSGKPTVVGSSVFTVEVTSGDGQTSQQGLSVTVNQLVLEPSELCSDNPATAIATFEDDKLREVIMGLLGVGGPGDLTCGLISGLTDLSNNCGYRGCSTIKSIVGIQNLTGLTRLELRRNSITDFSALSGLTSLIQLRLELNSITDLSALSGLTSLTSLDLKRNKITDISALSGLPSLTDLNLGFNRITDIRALSRLPSLTNLDLNNNSITRIKALIGLPSLTDLDLRYNSITDIGGLSGLPSLTRLDLRHNRNLSNIQPLLDNTGLGAGDRVSLGDTNVSCTDVAALT